MAFNFGLQGLEVKDKTAEYPIYEISGEPVLILKPATEANKPYFNAILKKSRKNVRAMSAGAVSATMIDDNRSEDRDLFPRYVIVDWRGIVDVDQKSVPFSESACAEFIEQLPDWLFDKIRQFAGNSANFVDVIDVETKAKN